MLRSCILAALCAAVAAALGGAAPAGTAAPQELSLRLSPERVRFGTAVTLHGAVVPAEEGVRVVVVRREGPGRRVLVRAVTDADGRFAARLLPARGSVLLARAAGTDVRSPAARLEVEPRVEVKAAVGTAFVGVPITLRVAPSWYAGRAQVMVVRDRQAVGQASGRVRSGLLRLTVPAPGVGRFWASVELGPSAELAGSTVGVGLRARWRPLSVGEHGPDVLALRRRLAALRFHVPAPQPLFDERLFDAVVAFQKERGLPRTGVVDGRTWRALATAVVPRARYRSPSPHIEVDKGRQILLVVRGGEVTGVLPVSSGATGNTPVGAFRILWKAPATRTWFGNAILYRTLTFHGNFAIHGFDSVPVYPASHGCVRVPVWAADWLYGQSPVGERVYVYQ